jgi:hypothetical protein
MGMDFHKVEDALPDISMKDPFKMQNHRVFSQHIRIFDTVVLTLIHQKNITDIFYFDSSANTCQLVRNQSK